ncbi:hypothetical protein RhiirA4_525989 [Rhizophagus irregularis]|uniref:Uncharacterized protein n=1 Tax=Rhizophagus irregularis TaxID=588596 RepID=A0A2I1FYX1_9GLOM|nr:hypothetical protein RhiirA4_525989 [Rhizophagus irregularis]
MFARDAIFPNQRHEPWWFRLLRRTSAIILVLAVIAYGYVQLLNLVSFVKSPNIVTLESKKGGGFPGFVICPGSLSPAFINKLNNTEIPQAEPQFSITCGKSKKVGPEILSENMNYTDSKCSSSILSEENGCLRIPAENIAVYEEDSNFSYDNANYNGNNEDIEDNEDNIDNANIDDSFQDPKVSSNGLNRTFIFYNIKPNIPPIEEDTLSSIDLPNFYTVYFDDLQTVEHGRFTIGSPDTKFVEYNSVPIIKGQRNILEYSILIHRVFSTNLMGQLDIRPDVFSMEFKVDTRLIPLKRQSSDETQLVIVPKNPHYFRTEIEKYEYQTISLVSNLGGFYGFIVTVYIALFGMSKVEPWGILQKIIFRCWNCRRSFKQHLADKYVSSAGIPFGENVSDRPEGTSLEDRLQILEYLLKDYYLDTYYLDKLKLTKMLYHKKAGRYSELETLIDTRNKAIENKERIDGQGEEDYLKEREHKRTVKRWSNWSRKFGFSSKPPKNTDDNVGMNSVDSVTSSVPSPKKSRWSNLSIMNYLPGFEIIDTIDEEIGIPSTSTQSTSTTNTTPTTNPSSITDFTSTTITKPRPFRCVVNESRDSQDTLVEIKVDKRQVYF